jgi:hypothetical protein
MMRNSRAKQSFRVRQRSSSKGTSIARADCSRCPVGAHGGEDGSGIGFERGDGRGGVSRVSWPIFLSTRRAVTAANERRPFQSGWRSASQLASAERQGRSAIRPWPDSVWRSGAGHSEGGVGEEPRRVLEQALLITVDGNHVIAPLFTIWRAISFCLPIASIVKIEPSRSMSRSFGIAMISLRHRPGRTGVSRNPGAKPPVRRRVRAAQRLAVRAITSRTEPAAKPPRRRSLSATPAHRAVEPPRARSAPSGCRRRTAENPAANRPPGGDLVDPLPVVRPANHSRRRRQKNLVQRIRHPPRDAVGSTTRIVQKTERNGVPLPRLLELILLTNRYDLRFNPGLRTHTVY